jgi:prepilin-type N-terminal cleavage/methylation domain-containing protein
MNTDRPIQTERTGVPLRGAGPVSSLVARRSLASFTLIELLVVVAVILILFSISMKVMSLANQKAGVAKTTFVIEQVKNGLGAFFSEYGCYPPVNKIPYTWLADPSLVNTYPTANGWNTSTGLVYYLWTDGTDGNAGAAKWNHYIDPVVGGLTKNPSNTTTYAGGQKLIYTNNTRTITDAWGREIHFEPANGNLGYKLWSDGPNRVNEYGTNDDIGVSTGL